MLKYMLEMLTNIVLWEHSKFEFVSCHMYALETNLNKDQFTTMLSSYIYTYAVVMIKVMRVMKNIYINI